MKVLRRLQKFNHVAECAVSRTLAAFQVGNLRTLAYIGNAMSHTHVDAGPQIVTHERQRAQRTTYPASYVRTLFDSIAPRYDVLNHILSSGLDITWRRKAVRLLAPHRPRTILDVATGTADFAIAAARLQPETIVGIDLSEEMLRIGRNKVARRGLEGLITLQQGDAEQLKFPDGSFDAVMVAFGIRNFSNLERGLQELHRVLAPDGISVLLEFSQPRLFLIRQLYAWYSRTLIPILGGLISKHREAYEYLPKTVREFPDGEAMLSILRSIGFRNTAAHPLTFGIATIYFAQKA